MIRCEKCHAELILAEIKYPPIKYIHIDGVIGGIPTRINETFSFRFQCPQCLVFSEYTADGYEFANEFYKSIINEPMKNVIKQIRKIKGVVTVDSAGENMAVVVFEPKKAPFLYGVDLAFGKDTAAFWRVPNLGDIPKPISEETAKKLMDIFKPKSLTPEELVDGKIYVDQYSKDWCNIFRFHDQQSRVYSILNTENGTFSEHDSCYISYSDTIRPATPSEAQSLILAEVANNYFHELKDVK